MAKNQSKAAVIIEKMDKAPTTPTTSAAPAVPAAYSLMQSNKTVEERIDAYFGSIKRNLQRDILDTLVQKIEAIEDHIFEQKDFTLSTDLNKGEVRLTKEECEKRFTNIIEAEYKLEILRMELAVKQASFNRYFEA